MKLTYTYDHWGSSGIPVRHINGVHQATFTSGYMHEKDDFKEIRVRMLEAIVRYNQGLIDQTLIVATVEELIDAKLGAFADRIELMIGVRP